MVTYTPQAVTEKGAGFLPFTGVSTLLQKHCNKKQETEECILKLCGYLYPQGTYTPQAVTEKGAGFLPFTGVSMLSIYMARFEGMVFKLSDRED